MRRTGFRQETSKLTLLLPYAGMAVGLLFLGAMVYAVYKLSKIRRITIDIEQE